MIDRRSIPYVATCLKCEAHGPDYLFDYGCPNCDSMAKAFLLGRERLDAARRAAVVITLDRRTTVVTSRSLDALDAPSPVPR